MNQLASYLLILGVFSVALMVSALLGVFLGYVERLGDRRWENRYRDVTLRPRL